MKEKMDEQSMKDNIRKARMRKGLSQQEVADALEITRVAYANLEKGRVRIVNEHISALASLLGISLEELLLGYYPEKDAAQKLLEAESEYDARFKKLRDEYDGRMDGKSAELAALRELAATQKKTIDTQESIIQMLRSRIPEENA